jgi:predicted N-acetyltransferase YhbS
VIGSVQCWPIGLRTPGAEPLPLVLLGPVVVAAARQGQGLASRLVAMALAAIDAAGAPPVLLIGDQAFYSAFGFSAAATGGWMLPGPVDPARLLLRGGHGLPVAGWVGPLDDARRVA